MQDWHEIEKRVENLLVPILEDRGLVLVDIEFKGAGNRKILRIFVDRPEGGITIGELSDLSEELSFKLDVEDPIQGSYILEVSSPGLDRELKKDRELNWAVGKHVAVLKKSGAQVKGTLVEVSREALTLDTEESGRQHIARSDVSKVRLDEAGRRK